jgi:hypothetical protein
VNYWSSRVPRWLNEDIAQLVSALGIEGRSSSGYVQESDLRVLTALQGFLYIHHYMRVLTPAFRGYGLWCPCDPLEYLSLPEVVGTRRF